MLLPQKADTLSFSIGANKNASFTYFALSSKADLKISKVSIY